MSNALEQFKSRIRFVKKEDILSIFPMVIGFILSLILRIRHRNIWLICERKKEARDNGYWFYKYLVEEHPEIEAVYAINRSAPDFNKVKNIGRVIQFGSLSHWMYYFAAKKNISSQKEGKPNAALCFALEVYFGARKNRVYLKHGITKDAQRWIYYDVSKINLFCCTSEREYEFVKNNFGYPEKNLVLTGMCRYDNLLSEHTVKRQILIMPTMREWLRVISKDTLLYENSKEFRDSGFFKAWNSLLDNQEMHKILEENGIELVFYLHSSMQHYADEFSVKHGYITIAKADKYDVQELLMESMLLITDYSSIFFDFAYMGKPIIFYQFDQDKYRQGQYQTGYFDYESDGFGPVVINQKELLDTIRVSLKNEMQMSEEYLKRANNFFKYRDRCNCNRVYCAINKMDF